MANIESCFFFFFSKDSQHSEPPRGRIAQKSLWRTAGHTSASRFHSLFSCASERNVSSDIKTSESWRSVLDILAGAEVLSVLPCTKKHHFPWGFSEAFSLLNLKIWFSSVVKTFHVPRARKQKSKQRRNRQSDNQKLTQPFRRCCLIKLCTLSEVWSLISTQKGYCGTGVCLFL